MERMNSGVFADYQTQSPPLITALHALVNGLKKEE